MVPPEKDLLVNVVLFCPEDCHNTDCPNKCAVRGCEEIPFFTICCGETRVFESPVHIPSVHVCQKHYPDAMIDIALLIEMTILGFNAKGV